MRMIIVNGNAPAPNQLGILIANGAYTTMILSDQAHVPYEDWAIFCGGF